MTVFLALAQPDGDWDHVATVLGIYTTREAAEKRISRWSGAFVYECVLDEDRKP